MIKLLLILPLLFWLGCEDQGSDSEKDDSIDGSLFSGMWEIRFYINFETLNLELTEPRYWLLIADDTISRRRINNFDTDSACYESDWVLIADKVDSTTSYDWELVENDSATLTIVDTVEEFYSFKAYAVKEDTLSSYSRYIANGIEYSLGLISQYIRIDSYDFTPVCEE